MTEDIDFEEDIADLEEQLDVARAELSALKETAETYELKTDKLRETLGNLRAAEAGRLPAGSSSGIPRVDVNPESGRPPRGARREQLEAICRKLGRAGDEFRTLDVLNELRDIERNLTDGMRSYTYAVMTTLQEEGIVEKVGRGTWVLG